MEWVYVDHVIAGEQTLEWELTKRRENAQNPILSLPEFITALPANRNIREFTLLGLKGVQFDSTFIEKIFINEFFKRMF